MICSFCGKEIDVEDKVSRNDICSYCHKDLRCCKQCKFYDPHSYNECREVTAERVVEKERSNFCDYFIFKGSSQEKVNKKEDAKKALEALFKK